MAPRGSSRALLAGLRGLKVELCLFRREFFLAGGGGEWITLAGRDLG